MTISELAILLRIKTDGAEKLKATEESLKATAAAAKKAAEASGALKTAIPGAGMAQGAAATSKSLEGVNQGLATAGKRGPVLISINDKIAQSVAKSVAAEKARMSILNLGSGKRDIEAAEAAAAPLSPLIEPEGPPALDKIAQSVAKSNEEEQAKMAAQLEKTALAAEKAQKKVEDFDAEGRKTNLTLKDMESWAGRTALKIDVLAASLLYLVDVAMKGAQALQSFSLLTGLSTQSLQAEQIAGRRAGIGPEEMTRFIEGMQGAGAQMQISGEGVGPWSLLQRMLGLPVDPRMDPLRLLNNLHLGLMRLRPEQLGIARTIAAQAGIGENIFQGLRSPFFNPDAFVKALALTSKNRADMAALNAEWGTLTGNIGAAGEKFVAQFAPALTVATRMLEKLLDGFSRFLDWLDRGSAAATLTKIGILALAAGIGVAALAFTGLAGAMGIAAINAAGLDLALSPVLATILAIAAAAAAAVTAFAGLGLLRNDVNAQLSGGKGLIPKKDLPYAIAGTLGGDVILGQWGKLYSDINRFQHPPADINKANNSGPEAQGSKASRAAASGKPGVFSLRNGVEDGIGLVFDALRGIILGTVKKQTQSSVGGISGSSAMAPNQNGAGTAAFPMTAPEGSGFAGVFDELRALFQNPMGGSTSTSSTVNNDVAINLPVATSPTAAAGAVKNVFMGQLNAAAYAAQPPNR
jgi:hypothetical protein